MSFLSFKLADSFIESYENKEPPFGFKDAAGNSLGELTFIRTYSRKKEDGSKERWWETTRRVIEGMYSIQKDWAKEHVLPWNDHKAQKSAQEAYELMFKMAWTPPGRGIFSMGTYVVNGRKDSTPLQNCAFISTYDMTKHDPAGPFTFLMNVSMLGVGVGYDTRGAEKEFVIHQPKLANNGGFTDYWAVPDSREGWVESVRLLLESYLLSNRQGIEFGYDQIRPRGAEIKTFGGVAPGPKPLMRLHRMIRKILDDRNGDVLTDVDIADIANLIGDCVVSGNVRRSALLAYGRKESKNFLNLKNREIFPERNSYDPASPGWAYMSNNSVRAFVGDDLSSVIPGIMSNGEPGIIWEDVTKAHGRLIDPPDNKDWRFAGFNPCVEQPLESGEMCTLADIHLSKVVDEVELKRALKYAYLYAKTVTLLPTHIPKTNAIMQRNRRIGISMSGIADFADNNTRNILRDWFDEGYHTLKDYDRIYSEWLGIRESIKLTTVKPTGTTSLLVGESPGGHWSPGGTYFNRAMRIDADSPIVPMLKNAGYTIETASESPDTTIVAYFPIKSGARRSEKEVSIFEKANIAVEAQRWWSDNGVSVTISFNAETEAKDVPTILAMYDGQLKAVSFLPMGNKVYLQQPYTNITEDEYDAAKTVLSRVDYSVLYDSDSIADAAGERGCTNDVCEVPTSILEGLATLPQINAVKLGDN
jgi:adenosylcobalamin-dependent ribonucleoside-triphosphate reductase